jgi:hypothetical protein
MYAKLFQRQFTSTMSKQQTFPQFPQLPAELQVAIIGYALGEGVKMREKKLKIHYNVQGGFRNRHLRHRGVRLPKLPAIYYVNRLFRPGAMRAHPTHHLFDMTPEVDRVPDVEIEDQRGSMVVFDATCDIFEIIIQEPEDYQIPHMLAAKLQLFFQLMDGNFKARIQHISVEVNAYWFYCSNHVANTLWNPQFLALSTFDIRLRSVLDAGGYSRYTLKACGDVDTTQKRFWEGDGHWRTFLPGTTIEKQNLAEKRLLQSLVQE